MNSGRDGPKDAARVGAEETRRRFKLGTKDGENASWLEQRVRRPVQAIYQTYVLELVLRRKPLPPSQYGRHVPLAATHIMPLIDERRGHGYISNTIRSSRYTIWDFLPKQFFFQATRLANFYFICIGIPQAIPGFSTTGSYTTILPLCFFLLLTIVKEGYDDFRRHRMDLVENNLYATVIRERHHASQLETVGRSLKRYVNTWLRSASISAVRSLASTPPPPPETEDDDDDSHFWAKVKWHDVKVGDILKLRRDDPAPADLALLYASGEQGVAYVDTMALDGETNLKSRQAPSPLRSCRDISGIKSCHADFVFEDPNRDLYNFNGSVQVDGVKLPLSLNDLILRGSTLRNTGTALGMVINTGEECKIRMNANHHPKAKKPRLERYTNQVVLTLILYVVVLSFGCAGGYLVWSSTTEASSWYLRDASVPYKQVIIGYMIMFNNVIPLALYVSLEIVKIGQMLMVSGDLELYDEDSNTPMTCNTNTILENLGQVGYVLSDKTGTLTENVMKFRGLSVCGITWLHRTHVEETGAQNQESKARSSYSALRKSQDYASGTDSVIVRSTELAMPSPLEGRTSGFFTRPSPIPHSTTDHMAGQERFTTMDLLDYIRQHPNAVVSQKAREFILALALCHTALPERQDDDTIDFQASSPDELALVRAAQDLGFIVTTRSTQTITLLQTASDGAQESQVYEILDVIEFSSKRKRMSIIVRCPNETIWLLCKGADSAILPRLKQAALAARKSQEVRKSFQIERDLQRKSEQNDHRNSFGGRPSLTLRGRNSLDVNTLSRRETLEVPRFSQSEKPSFRPSVEQKRLGRNKFDCLDDPAVSDDAVIFSQCFMHLNDFATEGLRTLLFAHKELSQEDYASWKKTYQDATTSLVHRQERIEAAGELIEQGLSLLGASAIEDKLQKGVPETIEKLRRANMKIWMLTGDKRETAINVAHAARLCQPTSSICVLDSTKGDLGGQLRDLTDQIHAGSAHRVAVIDGRTLEEVEAYQALANLFYSLIPKIDSVICCRASPAQKAGIVRAIRARMRALTMAIGDGANDIAMITAAHVGIGISGKEGLQAARVADFSIAQFRFLQRLLLVHGRWNYDRTAKFILWTYWKEMFFYLVQALFQRYNGYSGSSLYENWSLTVLNTLFTSLAVIVPGMFEQDLKAETLLAVPELYVYGQRNRGLNLPSYIVWMILAIIQGLLIWFMVWGLYGTHHVMGDNGAFAIGNLCFSISIMWTNVKLL